MKVVELLAEESLQDYSNRLVKTLNIKRLGSGAYAHVFQHPKFSNVVVKVFTAKDKVYKRYLTWVMKNQSNKYAPKIIQATQISSSTGDKYTIVFMEKMTKISPVKFKLWLLDNFGLKAVKNFDRNNDVALHIEMDKVISTIKDPDLQKIWAFIKSFGLDHLDIHPGNMMMRGSQLVFSDPVGAMPTSRIDGQ